MSAQGDLLALALKCEAATGPDKTLNREIALVAGWHRYTPSELRRPNPGWIAPEDWIGEHTGKDGRSSPILDSLHGTDIRREPLDFTASLDAAMTLVPEGLRLMLSEWDDETHLRAKGAWQVVLSEPGCDASFDSMRGYRCDHAATPALALCAAALRARAAALHSKG